MITNQLNSLAGLAKGNREKLNSILREMSEECIECKICVKQCAFLKKFGTPKKIADNWQAQDDQSLSMAFACSLCSLCTAESLENKTATREGRR